MSEQDFVQQQIADLTNALARSSQSEDIVQRQRREIRELETKARSLEEQVNQLQQAAPANSSRARRLMSAPVTLGYTLGSGSIQFMVELTLKE
jgi:uncharacterized protein YigA (DUF484 family)